MANTEIKSTVHSALRDTKSSLRDASNTAESIKDAASDMISEAKPKVKETFDQVSDMASDYYDRANSWLNTGSNRNYAFAGLLACVGFAGFFIGRSMNVERS